MTLLEATYQTTPFWLFIAGLLAGFLAVLALALYAIALAAPWLKALYTRVSNWLQPQWEESFQYLRIFFRKPENWRIRLYTRKVQRWWQRLKLGRWLRDRRVFWVLLAAYGSLYLLKAIFTKNWSDFLPGSSFPQAIRDFFFSEETSKDGVPTGAWTLLTALLFAPVAFVIWWFRDTNALWQIDNQRKDTNLKDFHQLAQWASGQHLPKDETQREANQPNATPASFDPSANTNAATSVLPTPAKPVFALLPANDSAASLQIAAIFQLQAFLQGEFGKHFQQPAFALLTSLWRVLMQGHVQAWQKDFSAVLAKSEGVSEEKKQAYEAWKKALQDSAQSPLAQAINQVLGTDYGRCLRQHCDLLPGLNLAGFNNSLPGLRPLELDGLGLRGINWMGAKLQHAQFQQANFQRSQLQGADFSEAQLLGANFERAQLQGAHFGGAQLLGADFGLAQLQGADFWRAQLQGADFWGAQLEGTDFRQAQLQGANFERARLKGASLEDIYVNAKTEFRHIDDKNTDEATKVIITQTGYDADPLATHAMRLLLRDQNGLQLVDAAYQEFAKEWGNASDAEKAKAERMARAQTAEERWPDE